MALDFIIENNKTYEKEYLPLGTETHWKIYKLAKENNLSLLSKISDYYSDYKFPLNQLDDLLIEVEKLLTIKQKEKDEDNNFLVELKNLIISAKEQKQALLVRAD